MKKGFTLAEILGVIVIIGILLILIVPTIINRINSSREEAENAGNNIIYDAADQYIREHPDDYPPGKSGRYCIEIKKLIEDGKLAEPVKDVTTGEDISDKSVMVTIYSAGTRDYEIRDGENCEAIAALPMIDFNVTPKGSSWVPKRTVEIIWPAIEGTYKARYRINKGEWKYVEIDNKVGGKTELIFDKSSKSTPLEAQYVGEGGETSSNNIISSKINIVNVDSVAPKCSLRLSGTKGTNEWYKSDVKVDFGDNNKNLTDDLSGVEDYGISIKKENTFGKISSQTQKEDTASITYYGYVKDKAGNIGVCESTFKKDATKPTISYTLRKINNGVDEGPAYSNQWSQRQIKRKFDPKDNLSGIARVEYSYNGTSGWTTEGNVGDWLMNEGKLDAYWRSVDNAGNTSSPVHLILLVDWTAPQCNVSRSNQYTTSGVNFSYSCPDNVSGTTNCPSTKYNQRNNVGSISIKDNAGNVGTCPAQTVYPQTQYRRQTRGPATCTSRCCGRDPHTYSCGCKTYACQYVWIGEGAQGAGGTKVKYYSSCPRKDGPDWYFEFSWCHQTKYCTYYTNRTCTSVECCNYTSWSGWSGWSTGNWCNSSTCRSESRTVYY